MNLLQVFKKSLGVTLVELLLVVTLLLMMGGLGSLIFANSFSKNRVVSLQTYYEGVLRKAENYARSEKNNGPWGVTVVSNNIVLFQGTSYAIRTTSLDQIYTKDSNITISGVTTVVFARETGIPDTSGTITISSNGYSAQIQILPEGVIESL